MLQVRCDAIERVALADAAEIDFDAGTQEADRAVRQLHLIHADARQGQRSFILVGDAARAAEVSIDDAALRGAETMGESLEQVSRAIVEDV